MKPKLIVHGGAWNIPKRYHDAHINGCRKTVVSIYPDLKKGLPALNAVERAVLIMEDDQTFDAGRGAFLNAIGEIELDALICDGRTLNFGAIAAVKNILHPISAARLVMEKSEHCMLVGTGAQLFIRHHNIPEVKTEDLLTKRELRYYKLIKSDPTFTTRKPFEKYPKGTVGAVALDTAGNLAAGTSTGGTPRKLPGRVGDSPIIGAGAYADNNLGAVSATGFGESIMKTLLSKITCDFFKSNKSMNAAKKAVLLMQKRVDGLGGVIGINKIGNYAYYHNTERMAMAFYDPDHGVIAGIDFHSLE